MLGWAPVPNASPGSSRTTTPDAASGGGSAHVGLTQSRSPNRIGLNPLLSRADPVRVGKVIHPGGRQNFGRYAADHPPEPVHSGREQARHADTPPERPVGGPGLESRVLPCVLEGDRDRSGLRERFLDRARALAGAFESDSHPAASVHASPTSAASVKVPQTGEEHRYSRLHEQIGGRGGK